MAVGTMNFKSEISNFKSGISNFKFDISNIKSCMLFHPIGVYLRASAVSFLFAASVLAAPGFDKDVRPILERRCTGCHGEEKTKGGLSMATLSDLMKGGDDGAVVVPGKSDESLLVKLIEHREKPFMPPAKEGPPLTADEIKLIRAWIDAGALAGPAAPTPLPDKPQAPAPAAAATSAAPKTQPAVGSAVRTSPGERSAERTLPNAAATPVAPKSQPAETAPPAPKPQPAAVTTAPSATVAAAPLSPATQPASHLPSQIGSLAFSPDGKVLAVGSLHTVELLNPSDGQVIKRLEGHLENVRALAFSRDGQLLAAAGGQPAIKGEVKIWNVAEARVTATIEGHNDCIYAVVFSPDGKSVATASYDKMIYVWEVSTGKQSRALKNHVDSVYDVAFSRDGKRLISVSADRSVKVWDAETGNHLYNLSESQGALYTVAIHPKADQVAAAGADRMIRVWDLGPTGGKLANSWFAHEKPILKIAYSPDGAFLYSTAQDRLLKTWDTHTLSELHVIAKQPDWNLALAVSPVGSTVGVGRYDGSLSVYDPTTGKLVLDKTPQLAKGPSDKVMLAAATQPAGKTTKMKKKKEHDKVGDFIPVDVVAGAVTFPPALISIDRKGAALGSTVDVTISGQNLADISEVIIGDNAIRSKIIALAPKPKSELQRVKFNTAAEISDESVGYDMKLQFAIGFEARPGFHEIRVRNGKGTSNGVTFFVEDLLEVGEKEPNDEPAAAQTITRSIVVLGAMNKPGDVDWYRINAQPGQTYVFEVIGSALVSSLNGSMTLTRQDGTPIARGDDFARGVDPRLAYEFTAAGVYYLSVSDRDMDAGGFYRMRVEDRSVLTGVFPLGVQKEKTAEIAVEGVGLGDVKTVKVSGMGGAALGPMIGVPVAGRNGPLLSNLTLAVGEHAELVESEPNDDAAKAQPVTPPITINGRIFHEQGTDGDADVYRFAARKGQRLIIDVMAQRLGSPLDSFVEVLDAAGNAIERATLRAVAKTFMVLADRDSKQAGLRLDNWDDLRVNDWVMVGSEVIRILQIPDYADKDVVFFASRGQRLGYLDTTPEHHAINTNVYKVEIHPPGKTFAPNGNPVFRVFTQNDDGGMPSYGKDSRVTFDPPADGDYLVRIRSASNDSNRRYTYRLSIRPPRPDFTVSAGGDFNIPAGSTTVVNAAVSRMDGFDGPVHIKLADLPPGFTATESDIPPDNETGSLTLTAGAGAKSTGDTAQVRLVATARIADADVVREGRLRRITVAECKPDVEVRLEPPVVNLPPGGTAEVTVHVTRNNGFAGRVQIEARDLPFGTDVANSGLNGILVTEAQQSRTFKIFSQPWARPMERLFTVTGQPATTAPQNFIYTAAPITLRITKDGQKTPQLVQTPAP